jgi:multidrug resistance efflux pump
MVVVKKELPDQRSHIRQEIPIKLEFRGKMYTVTDWSLGGFRIEAAHFLPVVGERLPVRIILTGNGTQTHVSTEVRIVRVSRKTKTIAARFIALLEPEKQILRDLIGRSEHGKMFQKRRRFAEDPIKMTPISIVPTAGEAAPIPSRRLRRRRIFYSILYFSSGAVLTGMVMTLLYSHFFRAKIDYAVVTMPLEPIVAQDVSRVVKVFVPEGQTVTQGAPIFRVEDDQLMREQQAAELFVAKAKANLRIAQLRVEEETKKVSLYRTMTKSKLDAAKGFHESQRNECKILETDLNRASALQIGNVETQQRVDDAKARFAKAEGQLMQAKGELEIAESAIVAMDSECFYDNFRLIDDLPQARIELDRSQAELEAAREKLSFAEQRISRLTYLAPYDCRVVKIFKGEGSTVNRGERLAILEKYTEIPVVDAFLGAEEVAHMRLGSQAWVWVPGLNKRFDASIAKIDRTNGFLSQIEDYLQESRLRFNWHSALEKSAYVQLKFVGLGMEDRNTMSAGMPVVVIVEKNRNLLESPNLLFGG